MASAKRLAYLAYLAITVVSAASLWLYIFLFVGETSMRISNVVIPPTLAFLVVCLIALWRRPAALRAVEVAQYVACYPIFLGMLALTMSLATDAAGRHNAVSAFAVWIPIVVMWAFLVFGSRGGVIASYGFLAASGVVGAVAAGGAPLGDAGLSFLGQLTVANLVFVAVLFGFSRLLERQITDRTAAEVAAEFALKDVLTGLHTRFALHVRFEQALALARRSGRLLAVCFVDLDDFKRVNDRHGHAAGDEMLRQFAQRIAAGARDSDTVARIGGDEFVVLAFVDDLDQARQVTERLSDAIRDPFVLDGAPVELSASFGISLYPHDGADGAALLLSADVAMYEAKANAKERRSAGAPGERFAALN